MSTRPLNQWDFIYQSGPGEATDDEHQTTYHMEVYHTANILVRGRPTDVEFIILTNADGVKYRCWRRKSPENNYAIILNA